MDDLIDSNATGIDENVVLRNKILTDTTLLTNLNSKSIISDSDSEEQHISEVISTILNNDDQLNENEIIETAKQINGIDIENESQQQQQQQQQKTTTNITATRPCQFSISRIKNIMKLDPELSLTSKESVFLVAKATELFVDFISKESYKYTVQASRKTIQKKDIEQAVANIDPLYFLEAALD